MVLHDCFDQSIPTCKEGVIATSLMEHMVPHDGIAPTLLVSKTKARLSDGSYFADWVSVVLMLEDPVEQDQPVVPQLLGEVHNLLLVPDPNRGWIASHKGLDTKQYQS